MSIFDVIKSKINVHQYISQFVELDGSGHGFCPFHPDKNTKSFYCKEGDSRFHCFGCDASGDIFDFISLLKGYSKADALKVLAEEVGVKITDADSKTAKAIQDLQEKNKKVVEVGKKNITVPNAGMDYLKARGLTQEAINFFDLGYFGGDRNYIYLPIKDRFGKYVGGSMRFLNPAEGQPKYINTKSDEYDIFKKGEILYNLSNIRHKIKDKLFIMEGYFDVITAWQLGFETAVGFLSSSITKAQATIIRDTISKDIMVVLVPDNDETGKKNILRNYQLLRLFLPENSIHIALIPGEAKDLNEYIGKSQDYSFMDKTEPVELYLVEQVIKEETDKQRQFLRIKQFLDSIQSPVIKSQLLERLSRLWGKPQEIIENYFKIKTDDVDAVPVYGAIDLSNRYEAFIDNIVKNQDSSAIHLNYGALDKYIRRVNPGEVVMVMGRAGVGKTAFAINLLKQITRHEQIRSLFFSLEQQGEQICERMLSISNGVSAKNIEQMFVNGDGNLSKILEIYYNAFYNVYTVDKDSLTIEQIEKIIVHNNMVKHPVKVVAIDYMGYIKSKYPADPYVSTSLIAKELKGLAKRLNIVLIVLLQLSREGGSGGIPVTMRMGRESGVIEESADYLLGLWRPDLEEGLDETEKLSRENDGEFYVEVLKNRSGRCGRGKLHINLETLRITDRD